MHPATRAATRSVDSTQTPGGSNKQLRGITGDGTALYAAGQGTFTTGAVYRDDGGGWTEVATAGAIFYAVCVGGGKVVAVGGSSGTGISTYSPNGVSAWQSISFAGEQLNGCTWDGVSSFYAVGEGGGVFKLTPP